MITTTRVMRPREYPVGRYLVDTDWIWSWLPG